MLRIIQGDCREAMKALPDASVHCIVTSPPYFGLRDYGVDCQIGLEKTPQEYIAALVLVFRECRRVLRNDGTLWLNVGDSYAGGASRGDSPPSGKQATSKGTDFLCGRRAVIAQGFKPKDLMMIPGRLAIALCDDGWYLRSEIVWSKPNPMPESVTDRPTRSHEMVYLLSKSARYFYDAEAIREPISESTVKAHAGRVASSVGARRLETSPPNHPTRKHPNQHHNGKGLGNGEARDLSGRNRRSVWTIPTQPTPDAHFATFPEALVEPCILAGTSAHGCCVACAAPYKRILEPTPEYAKLLGKDWSDQAQDDAEGRGHFTLFDGSRAAQRPVKRNAPSVCAEYVTAGWQATCDCYYGPTFGPASPSVVLDCFAGSGTVGMVALKIGRRAILIEAKPEYVDLIKKRTAITPNLMLAALTA